MNLNNKILYKKIYKETPEIINTFGNYTMKYIKEQKYIELQVEYENFFIQIKFIGFFPFQKPEVLINNKFYRDMLLFNDSYCNKYLDNLNIKCLCCQSILCANNWTPMFGVIEILNEIKNNSILIKKMIVKKYLVKICILNNINCVELQEKIAYYL